MFILLKRNYVSQSRCEGSRRLMMTMKIRKNVSSRKCEAKTILRNNFRTERRQRLGIGTEEDSIHQLDRAAQVTIFRLSTGHCQLLSHLHSAGPQTPKHTLQSCPTFDSLRRQTWPSPVDAHRKLWGPAETLRQTVDFALLTGLKI